MMTNGKAKRAVTVINRGALDGFPPPGSCAAGSGTTTPVTGSDPSGEASKVPEKIRDTTKAKQTTGFKCFRLI
jgi:hypothetical protein